MRGLMIDPVAANLREQEVLDEYGAPVRLGNLWKERTAVLVFVRHFGCVLCRRQVAGLQEMNPQIAATGARLFVIGMGAVSFITGLRDSTGYQGPVLLDPDRKAYQAAALKRSMLSIFDPRSIRSTWSALHAGFKQGLPQGSTTQLGGLFVITPQEQIRLSHIEQYAGDVLPGKRLLAALK